MDDVQLTAPQPNRQEVTMSHADGGKRYQVYLDEDHENKNEVVLASYAARLEQQVANERTNHEVAAVEWGKCQDKVAELTQQVEQLQGELGEWKAGRMADASGHLFRCAKVNEKWSCSNGCAMNRAEQAEARIEQERHQAAVYQDALGKECHARSMAESEVVRLVAELEEQRRLKEQAEARVKELEEQYAELKDDRNHSDELLHRVQVMFKPDALGYCWQGNGSIYESIKQLQAHLATATARVKWLEAKVAWLNEKPILSEFVGSVAQFRLERDKWLAAEPKHALAEPQVGE